MFTDFISILSFLLNEVSLPLQAKTTYTKARIHCLNSVFYYFITKLLNFYDNYGCRMLGFTCKQGTKAAVKLMALFEIEMGGSICIIIEIVPGVTIKLNLELGLGVLSRNLRSGHSFDINHRSM